ncbi:MAG: HPr(Ser) kinase/phosphatase [Thermodesulfobacteriota bacterium]
MAISVTTFQKECSGVLRMRLLAGEQGGNRQISSTSPREAGLAIAGEPVPVEDGRIQLLGEREIAYFLGQEPSRQADIADRFFAGPSPCAVVGGAIPVPQPFVGAADRRCMPLFSSSLPTSALGEEIQRQLQRLFRESTTIHGVLMDVLGVGVLLVGRSGVGKSECALDLVLRGSRFVADDVILVEKPGPSTLVGGGNDLTQHHMEIRGLGILNIRDLFGVTATAQAKKIELVIRIEAWDAEKEYDRLGLESDSVEILGVRLPSVLVPVSPGRNLATIVEAAVRNHLLKLRGIHSAAELVDRQTRKASESGTP